MTYHPPVQHNLPLPTLTIGGMTYHQHTSPVLHSLLLATLTPDGITGMVCREWIQGEG